MQVQFNEPISFKKRRSKMNSEKKAATILKDVNIDVKIKLAALWVAVMLSYVYNDIFDLYKPGEMERIMRN
jgi:hypothetical protein